mmetsp:Transcript_41566/g.109473  ORF Transcript_41566/g.109473 Transcript_41566/m.109473 type:complete len:256 (+) Transcript_41566:1773-2540(+)
MVRGRLAVGLSGVRGPVHGAGRGPRGLPDGGAQGVCGGAGGAGGGAVHVARSAVRRGDHAGEGDEGSVRGGQAAHAGRGGPVGRAAGPCERQAVGCLGGVPDVGREGWCGGFAGAFWHLSVPAPRQRVAAAEIPDRGSRRRWSSADHRGGDRGAGGGDGGGRCSRCCYARAGRRWVHLVCPADRDRFGSSAEPYPSGHSRAPPRPQQRCGAQRAHRVRAGLRRPLRAVRRGGGPARRGEEEKGEGGREVHQARER